MFQVDLTNCEREPIHIPGRVQSHGFLIAVDKNNLITHYSSNLAEFLPAIPKDILGQPAAIFDPFITPWSIATIIDAAKEGTRPNHKIDIAGSPWNIITSNSDQYTLIEFEPEASSLGEELHPLVGNALSDMLQQRQLPKLLDAITIQIKKIIGYHRVMIYKFHDDDHGEVVAEAKDDELEPWLGLHYPAGDIPAQARRLYMLNLVRLIADVDATPAALVTATEAPLDLTNAGLRAVSPIHIQYLKNMKVASSFSVSIVDQDRLWGLIACHSYSPRFINYEQRTAARLIGQVLSSAISFRQAEEDQQISQQLKDHIADLTRALLRDMPVEDALFKQATTLQHATYATGAALYYENRLYTTGKVPEERFIARLIDWLTRTMSPDQDIYATHQLSAHLPEAAPFKSVASGLLACRLKQDLNELIIWFKPEVISTVTWAGDPEKSITIVNDAAAISPRTSFAAWSQKVLDQSEKWLPGEIKTARMLRDEVNYAISRKASELRLLNEKLREAYAELDAFSYTISHDLKNPVSAIRGFSQLIAMQAGDNEGIRTMAARIEARTLSLAQMIDEVLKYSKLGQSKIAARAVNMQKMLMDIRQDLLVAYDNPRLNIAIGSTPELEGDETMILQVFSNLLSNAVKYSSKADAPVVIVTGQQTANEITYSISDNGVGIDPKDHQKIFDLFTRSDSGKDFEGSGVGLAIVKRILARHEAEIWVESAPDSGSTFFVKFRRPA